MIVNCDSEKALDDFNYDNLQNPIVEYKLQAPKIAYINLKDTSLDRKVNISLNFPSNEKVLKPKNQQKNERNTIKSTSTAAAPTQSTSTPFLKFHMKSTADEDLVDPDAGEDMKSEPPPSVKSTAAAGVDFSEVYSLLTKHQQSSNSLVLPLNDPTFNHILDLLTVQGIEKLADRRWEQMAGKIQNAHTASSSAPAIHRTDEQKEDNTAEVSEELKWLELQRASYQKYEELHKLDSKTVDENDFVQEDDSSNMPPNHLTAERYDRLRNVGVAMNKWELRLMELKRYYEERGDCDVPIQHPGGLGLWVATQKVAYRFDKATMPQSRIDALDAMGFTWQSQKRKDSWSRYFDELVDYIRQHGTSHVSIYDENYIQLGSWVKRQRAEYKKYMSKGRAKSQMTKERIDKLESIGFQWRLKPDKITWDDRFEALKKFKATYGHCRPARKDHPDLNTWTRYQRLNYQYFLDGKSSRLTRDKFDKLTCIGINDPVSADVADEEQDDETQDEFGAAEMNMPEIPPFMSHTI